MKVALLNRILIVLGFIGIFIAGYLSLSYVMDVSVPCGPGGGCDKVLDSSSSRFGGQPVAYFGFLGYVALTGLAIWRSRLGFPSANAFVLPGYVIAAIGALASLYLQYVALFQIKSFCVWCLASALVMVATWILYAILAQRLDDAEPAHTFKVDFPIIVGLLAISAIGLGASAVQLKSVPTAPPITVSSEFPLIPPNPHSTGDPNSPLTIVEFADMECPACRKTSPALKEFIKKYPGRVRIVYRHWPLLDKHPVALPAALISEAMSEKGLFWDYLIAVMSTPETPTSDELFRIAETMGADPVNLKARIANAEDPIYDRVQRDMAAADRLGLQGTPTFIFVVDGKPAGTATSQNLFDRLQEPKFKKILEGSGTP